MEVIMPHTVVIADDITGANDIGIMYSKAGLDSVVYSYDKLEQGMEFSDDVTIIDTNSRFCSYEDAYQRVYEATKRFDKNKVQQFYDKQCSVFRGNIGAEFDAMLDALNEEFAIVVLGFPDNGRTTLHSIHYVYGTRLEESQFRNDPVHPMRQSNLVDILQAQTKRKVSAIPYEVLEQGVEALQKLLKQMQKETNYAILDVRNNDDLSLIAKAVKDYKVICGSSALGYYLGLLQTRNKKEDHIQITQNRNSKMLCIAGSLTPQTKAQLNYMEKKKYPVLMLDTTKLFSEEERRLEEERILKEYEAAYQKSDIIVIHSMNKEEDVQNTKRLAASHHIDNTAVSEMVSYTLAKLAKQISKQYHIQKYIICGGDTSASFCSRMDIKGMRVIKEIEAGLPICQSITMPYDQLILKSGSFGSVEFIEKAKNILTKE
ncbi:MAG TPA: serine kinase [Lachnospiraceae bacterium]|jgi:uncharacterized protein YgbK (DUF1537 family)|nr:four-carbon acid sugar kinase family protein [Lachnospiraceae bacterium]HBI72036.1 serine kinase [Lachnospiraceae bacterium]HBY72816.1 serine kinase [Lachnospiraceae bacterium]HCA69405.1 serine kinase [Lachnospiraceae bacterium]HCM13904.1 serine kinase [Lachnospiraceae bacterium]